MNILGIQLDFPYIRTCAIRKKRHRIEIRSLHEEINLNSPHKPQKNQALSEDRSSHVKPLYFGNFKGRIVSGLSAKNFLTRVIEVKIPGGRHIEEAIAFQSEALSHLKPEEIITVPLIEKKEKGTAEALLFTVLREGLRTHLRELEGFKVDPDAVSTVPSALCHFIRWKFPKLTDAFIIDLGSNEITCALLEKEGLKKSHVVSKGVENLLNALHEDRKKILLKKEIEGAAKQIDLLLLKPALNPHLSEELIALRQELAKIYYSFTKGLPKPVIFTGRGDALMHLREFLFDFPKDEWPLSSEEQKFAVSIGLALDQTTQRPLQLRQEEFFPRKNWARMGFYALSLLASSILLSVGLFSLGIRTTSQCKQQMLESLQTSSRKNLFTEGSMQKQIDQWIDAIEANNSEYPYILQAPKAAEVLSWFSSHPLLNKLKQEEDPIDLREIRYQLSSFPMLHSRTDPFVAKVEIEFNFKNLMNARKFHEALREGDSQIDPHSEITWEALNEGYRASFYMKNRSPYVP